MRVCVGGGGGGGDPFTLQPLHVDRRETQWLTQMHSDVAACHQKCPVEE